VYKTGKKLPCFLVSQKKGSQKLIPGLIMDFGRKFLNARQPALCHVRRIFKKAMELGTELNMKSKTCPGNSFCGRSQHVAREDNDMCRRAVMDVRNKAEKCIANHEGHFK